MKQNQEQKILKYMQDFGSITSLQAMQDLGCMRLASRISDMKKNGILIKSETISSKNRYGETVHYSRYSLIGGL